MDCVTMCVCVSVWVMHVFVYVYDCVCSGYMCVPFLFAIPISTTVMIPVLNTFVDTVCVLFTCSIIKMSKRN